MGLSDTTRADQPIEEAGTPAPRLQQRPVRRPPAPVVLTHRDANDVVKALRKYGALLRERDGRALHVVDSLADCVDLAIEQANQESRN